MKKQLLRILLVACLLVVLLPTAALAEGTGYELIGGTEGFSGEGPGNLVDGNINTKWCLEHKQMSWVIFKTPEPMKVTGYSITTGNDNAENHGRNPKSWELYGSTEVLDSSNSRWEAIVNVGSDTTLQDKNSTTYYFDLDRQTEKAYQYFMLKISATQSSSVMQMSEFALTSCAHEWQTITVAPTCAEDGYTYEKCSLCGRETEKTAGSSATGHHYVNGECEYCGLKPQNHYLCGGGTCTQIGDHTCTERTEFTPWEKTDSLPTESGHYFLNVDVTIGETWKPADGTQLCLNGHSIVQTSGTNTNQVAAITVEKGKTFTLTDCAATPGTITHQSDAKGCGVSVNNGSFIMYGGKISGNTSSGSNGGEGGGAYISNGSFTMYGGEISGNTADSHGGGVRLTFGSGFTMYGGKISNNYAAKYGGGISAYESVNITLNNGQIIGNTAGIYGGGISMIGGSSDFSDTNLYIKGGEIRGNKVLNRSNSEEIRGGGIYISRSTAYMTGGRISENSIEGNPSFYSSGAGVAVDGIFHMNGGEITNNTNGLTVCGGGGVYVGGTFYMTAGTISGNYVYGCGGGFMVLGALHMTGGTITGNSAWHGGGVYVATKKAEMIDKQNYSNSISSSRANMTVGGTAKITGNVRRGSKNADTGLYENTEENNVYLPFSDEYFDQKIKVLQGADALTTGAYISVGTQNLPTAATTIPITDKAPESSAYFHSDRPGYDIGASDSAVVLKVGRKVPKLSLTTVSVPYTGSDIPATAITGTATYNGETVPGTWSWKDGNAPKTVADSTTNGNQWYAVFTPTDGTTYYSKDAEVTVTIAPKPVTATVTVTDKTYDTTNTATVSAAVTTEEGLAAGDTITITGLTGTFDNVNAGTGKTVTVNASNVSISGDDKDNYSVTIPATAQGTILKADQTAPGAPTVKADATTSAKVELEPITTTGFGAVQYAASTTTAAPTDESAWQASAVFTGLTKNTQYYFFARYAGDANHNPSPASTGTSNQTLDTYTITYDLNGGSGTTPTAQTQDVGTGFTTAVKDGFDRTGYSFLGWAATESAATAPYAAGAAVSGVAANTTLYAVWQPIIYNIDYALNGGTVSTANPETYTVETASFTLNNPTRIGYTFAGWTDGSGSDAQLTVTVATGSVGHRTYTATWTAKQ